MVQAAHRHAVWPYVPEEDRQAYSTVPDDMGWGEDKSHDAPPKERDSSHRSLSAKEQDCCELATD